MQEITINPASTKPPTRDNPQPPSRLPEAKAEKQHPSKAGSENASVYFIGTATTILPTSFMPETMSTSALVSRVLVEPTRLWICMISPGLTLFSSRITMVEASLRRDLPIVTTPHAKKELTSKGDDSFTNVHDLDPFQQSMVNIIETAARHPRIRVTGMPGKHVAGPMETINNYLAAIPPTNGWMVELGYEKNGDFKAGYRIYISGDTLMVDDLKEIPKRYSDQPIDLMLVHLGGTTVPSPKMSPLAVMVTMDAKQGVEMMQLMRPDVTIPIHFDDYEVFASPLEDFQKLVKEQGLDGGVVYLDRGEKYQFCVRDH